VFFSLAMAVGTGWAQCHQLAELNAGSPEGQLLQQASQESDAAKKLALLEQFAGQYTTNEAIGWVDEQLLDAYVKASDPDKALAVGEKLDAIPPECVETSQQTLKAAEMKKDPDLVMKWSAKTAELAQKVVASPQPKEEDQVEHWKSRVDYAKQVNTYTEYSLYATALQTQDPKKQVELLEALQKRNPKSEYLAKATGVMFQGYQKAGANDKALALAQKTAAAGQPTEDMLLVLSDDSLRRKDSEKVHTYTGKLIEMTNAAAKPEGVADADWTKRKNTILGLGYYMSGKDYYNQGKFAPADKDLRQALPLVESNVNIRPEVLYLLAYANYKLQKIQEAANYYKACAAVKSPFQALANKNLTAIHAEFHGIR
jgi:tetratricopeptide (TPR) repeat protein